MNITMNEAETSTENEAETSTDPISTRNPTTRTSQRTSHAAGWIRALLRRGDQLILIALCLLLLTGSIAPQPAKADPAVQASSRILLPLIRTLARPFNPSIDGFSFANYAGQQYATLTSVEMQRMFGAHACEGQSKNDGSCALTPAAQQWMKIANGFMKDGYCEGLSLVSLLIYTGQLKPQDFGAARTVDLSLDGNTKLQHEIAYWYATLLLDRSATVTSSPNAVVAALRNALSSGGNALGSLRFSKPDGSGGHSVVPISLTDRANNQVAISVYDSNYPLVTNELLVDSAANTWFYSPEPTLTEDDYRGDAQSQTLGFAPLTSRVGLQSCPFCSLESLGAANQKLPAGLGTAEQNPYSLPGGYGIFKANSGSGVAVGPYSGGVPPGLDYGFPSSNHVSGPRSWNIPAQRYYTAPVTETVAFRVTGQLTSTNAISQEVTYVGPGYVFDLGHLPNQVDRSDLLEIGPSGKTITYTTSVGDVPELFFGFETTQADFELRLDNFEMKPGDSVSLQIDTVRHVMKMHINTASPTDDVNFTLDMERIGDTSSEIFDSPADGITLANDQTLLIDYSAWNGNGSPLRMGYDSNSNGILDAGELFLVNDVGDAFVEP